MELLSIIIADGKRIGQRRGTVKKRDTLRMRLLIPRERGTFGAYLMLKNDDAGFFDRYDMEWTGFEQDDDIYEIKVPVDSVGLFWYYFEIDGYRGREFSYKAGSSVQFSPEYAWMNPLQLTVYERKYEVPSFLEGGIFYHVFVDRFYKGDLKTSWEKDPVKSHYGKKSYGEHYDNTEERSVIIRDDWGNEPIWTSDLRGEILNNDFFGGNLDGVRKKLPYLESLGVTCIYLSPIFEAYSSHKYDTGNYMKIDAMFGDEDEFARLCSEAKDRGISIILDGVFNHTGSDSLYFNQYGTYSSIGAFQSYQSPYRGWFQFRNDGLWESWWGIMTLPSVNKSAEGLRELLFSKDGVIRKWIRLGASGWRLDVVDELPEDFLKELVSAAKAEKKDAVILGEVWEDASNKIAYGSRRHYFQGEELDSCMNYPWKDAIIKYLRECDSHYFIKQVEEICENYPPEVLSCLMNPLGTHDSVRILTALAGVETAHLSREQKSRVYLNEGQRRFGVRLLKMAAVLQMTLPGVPCIYYGDEAESEGANDPFNRWCYPWGKENGGLVSWYKNIGNFRNKHREVFAKGQMVILHEEYGCVAYARIHGEKAIVIMENRSDRRYHFQVDESWEDALTPFFHANSEQITPALFQKTYGKLLDVSLGKDYGILISVGESARISEWEFYS